MSRLAAAPPPARRRRRAACDCRAERQRGAVENDEVIAAGGARLCDGLADGVSGLGCVAFGRRQTEMPLRVLISRAALLPIESQPSLLGSLLPGRLTLFESECA